MLVLALSTLPMIPEPKTKPAPSMQAPANTGMATAITKHLVPGPAWSPELGRREPALPCLQIQKTQFQLPASQTQSSTRVHGGGVAQDCVCLRCNLLDSPSTLTAQLCAFGMCQESEQSVSHRQRTQLQPAWSCRTQAQ